jgi:hypothetical protein
MKQALPIERESDVKSDVGVTYWIGDVELTAPQP